MPVEQFTVVPDGWVLVPREPTEAMLEAGNHARDPRLTVEENSRATYRAMLSASPKEVSHGR